MSVKRRRFFYHFNKHTGKLTIHWLGACWPVDNVNCVTGCKSKWNARQPRLVMTGWAHQVSMVTEQDGSITGVIQ